jgi:hypothetical protein
MRRMERAYVVGFTIVVPGDDLQKPGSERQDFIPAVVP